MVSSVIRSRRGRMAREPAATRWTTPPARPTYATAPGTTPVRAERRKNSSKFRKGSRAGRALPRSFSVNMASKISGNDTSAHRKDSRGVLGSPGKNLGPLCRGRCIWGRHPPTRVGTDRSPRADALTGPIPARASAFWEKPPTPGGRSPMWRTCSGSAHSLLQPTSALPTLVPLLVRLFTPLACHGPESYSRISRGGITTNPLGPDLTT